MEPIDNEGDFVLLAITLKAELLLRMHERRQGLTKAKWLNDRSKCGDFFVLLMESYDRLLVTNSLGNSHDYDHCPFVAKGEKGTGG